MFRYQNLKNIGFNNENSPSVYSYETGVDNIATITSSNYFSDPRAEFREGDTIIVNAVDGNCSLVMINGNTASLPSIDGEVTIRTAPTGFNWPETLPAITAMKVGDQFSCNIKPEDLIDFSVFTNTLYVDSEMPNNSGDGTSWSQAEKAIGLAIDTAIASGVATRILVKGGVYYRNQSIANSNLSKVLTAPIALQSVYGDVITGTFDELTYTKTSGQDFVYEAVRSSVVSAFNPQITGSRASGKLYKEVSSISDCNAEDGTYYTDNVTFYVHPFGSVQANNTNVLACLHATGANLFGNSDIYMSGIKCFGGYSGALHIENGSTNTVVVNNCSFQLAAASGGYCKRRCGGSWV